MSRLLYLAWLSLGPLLAFRPSCESRAGKILLGLAVLALLAHIVGVSYNLLRFVGALV